MITLGLTLKVQASSSREAATDQWAFGQGAGEAGDFSERRTPNLLIS